MIAALSDPGPEGGSLDPMATIPTPVACRQVFDPEEAARVRRLDCRHYSACLSVACRQRWEGFSCRSCPAYLAPTEIETRADLDGLAGIVANVVPFLRIVRRGPRSRRRG